MNFLNVVLNYNRIWYQHQEEFVYQNCSTYAPQVKTGSVLWGHKFTWNYILKIFK